MSYYAAIDLGAESGRVIRGAIRNGKLTIEEVHRFPNTPVPVQGTTHWNVLGLLREIRAGLRRCSSQEGEDPAGIGIDTWGVDFGLIDDNGNLLTNPVHYRDGRTEGMIDLACSILPREEIYRITGTAFQPFNTLYQLLALHRSDPPWLRDARTLLFMPDLLSYFLCGSKGAEYTIASTAQLLDARTRNWSDELCQKLKIRRKLLPDIVEPGTVIGRLTEENQRECNMGPASVVAPASHDTGSAFAAVPASSELWAALSCGTWSVMGTELSEPQTDAATLAHNFANEGSVEGKVRLIKNIMGLWVLQECRRTWAREGQQLDYATLTGEANATGPFPFILDIDDNSFYAPENMLEAIRDFCDRTGQKMPDDRGEIVRAINEGIALRYRAVLNELEQITGKTMPVIHMVGGGTQNELLCQMAANATGRPVIAGPVEATAIGNLVMQAVATGELGSVAEARELIRNSTELKNYEPTDTSSWDDAFGRYTNLTGNSQSK